MSLSLATILHYLITYKYAVMLPIAIVEGPIITVLAGFLAARGIMNIGVAYIIAVIGDLVGDAMYYAIGRYGGKRAAVKYGHFLGITADRLASMENYVRARSARTIFFGKFTQAFGVVTLVAAGIAHVPFKKFMWHVLLATIPKVVVFLILGYLFGSAYETIDAYIKYGSLVLAGIIIIGAYAYRRFYR